MRTTLLRVGGLLVVAVTACAAAPTPAPPSPAPPSPAPPPLAPPREPARVEAVVPAAHFIPAPPPTTPAPAPSAALTLPSTPHAAGRLPPEVIQRIMRANFPQFRLCYEAALRNCPNLRGRVGVRFVIGLAGEVAEAEASNGDIPDEQVQTCVEKVVRTITFPKPEGGPVTVSYPIVFTPGG